MLACTKVRWCQISPMAARLAAAKEAIRAEREPLRQALSVYLAPRIVERAVYKPKTCHTLWHLVEDEALIAARADETRYTQDKKELTEFLKGFFSDEFVRLLCGRMEAVGETSWLGSEYTMRVGKAKIVNNIMEGLRSYPTFKPCLALTLINEEELEEIDIADECEHRPAVDLDARKPVQDRVIQNMLVHQVKLDHQLPVAARSQAFAQEVHDVADDQTTCYLYHGVFEAGLNSFEDDHQLYIGPYEFGWALYAFTSARHAFEHPLHCDLTKPTDERVSVLAFEMDIAVLHGVAVPPLPSRTTPFVVKRFLPGEDFDEWLHYCRSTLDYDRKVFLARKENSEQLKRCIRELSESQGNPNVLRLPRVDYKPKFEDYDITNPEFRDYDIVIGPVCVPSDDFASGTELSRGGGVLNQVAFRSRDSWTWFLSCFCKVFQQVDLS